MSIIVFQHSDANRPGRLGRMLRDHSFKLDIHRPDRGEAIPVDFDDVDGVISLGGPQSPKATDTWMAREIEFMREAHERSLPVIGLCLGHDLLALALGGEVGDLDTPEVGMLDVEILPAGQTDTILSGIAWRSPQLLTHAQHVTMPPPGAAVLARSEACAVQVFRVGLRSYGFQYHFEADESSVKDIAQESRQTLLDGGLTPQQLDDQMEVHGEMFGRLADRLCLNLATYLIPKVATVVG